LIAHSADEIDLVRNAPERHHRAIFKRDRFGKAVDLALEPVHMSGEEVTRLFNSDFLRKGKNSGAFCMADFKGEAAGSAGSAQLERTVNSYKFDFKRCVRSLRWRD
jgi:hypothetical protein